MTDERAMMAKFDRGHRLPLPHGHWLEKTDENIWQIGGPDGAYLAMHITGNVPVGHGGSMDGCVERFAKEINR